MGKRLREYTASCTKCMVPVNGTPLIDRMLDQLAEFNLSRVVIVVGYQGDKLISHVNSRPRGLSIEFVRNPVYDKTNNISSAVLALDALHDGCYFCEADLYITNPEVITKYQYASNILGSYSMETDDWSFKMVDGYLDDYKKGNTYCYNYYGISYWTSEDCVKLKRDFTEVYNDPNGGKDYFWEFVPFVLKHKDYKVEIRQCHKQDIMEIDNFYELAQLDPTYAQ